MPCSLSIAVTIRLSVIKDAYSVLPVSLLPKSHFPLFFFFPPFFPKSFSYVPKNSASLSNKSLYAFKHFVQIFLLSLCPKWHLAVSWQPTHTTQYDREVSIVSHYYFNAEFITCFLKNPVSIYLSFFTLPAKIPDLTIIKYLCTLWLHLRGWMVLEKITQMFWKNFLKYENHNLKKHPKFPISSF